MPTAADLPVPTAERPPLSDFLPAAGAGAVTSDELLDRFLAFVKSQQLELYPAQEEALLELWAGRHVVLATPTGSGKSLVALGLQFKAAAEGRRSFYTSPIKALASEEFLSPLQPFSAPSGGDVTATQNNQQRRWWRHSRGAFEMECVWRT